jgi:hypothetical protein
MMEMQPPNDLPPKGEIIAKVKNTMNLKKNLFLQNQQANLNQFRTWYKSSLGKVNLKLYKSRARSSSKGEVIAKIEWGNLKSSSQEPKSQRSSD